MTKDPAFLFYPGDYLRDTQCLSSNVQVAYDRIMCEHMRNICITQKQLTFFTKRLTDDERDELLMVLTEGESGFSIQWVAESIVKRRAYSDSRRKNREGKTNNICKTYDKHMDNENVIEDVIKKEVKKEKVVKHKYGEYSHVLLTDDQIIKLHEKFDQKGTVDRIKNLDEYVQMKGTKYKDHYLTILKWSENDKPKQNTGQYEEPKNPIPRITV